MLYIPFRRFEVLFDPQLVENPDRHPAPYNMHAAAANNDKWTTCFLARVAFTPTLCHCQSLCVGCTTSLYGCQPRCMGATISLCGPTPYAMTCFELVMTRLSSGFPALVDMNKCIN
jgi:hypothetical protein